MHAVGRLTPDPLQLRYAIRILIFYFFQHFTFPTKLSPFNKIVMLSTSDSFYGPLTKRVMMHPDGMWPGEDSTSLRRLG